MSIHIAAPPPKVKTEAWIRLFDLIFSITSILIFIPLILLIAVVVKVSSPGPVFFRQQRIGRFGKTFLLMKFRSMYVDSERHGYLTVGSADSRITKVGLWLRRNKLDELPQLFNILKGEMSFVGPRPEVKKYVDLYTAEQLVVLSVKPGLTDYASLEFYRESEMLDEVADSVDPEWYYIHQIMPRKIEMNKCFIENYSVAEYIKIIFLTQLSVSRFRQFLIRNKVNPKSAVFLIDLAVSVAAMNLAFFLSTDAFAFDAVLFLNAATACVTIASLLVCKPHNGVIVFSWLHETVKIISSVFFISVVMILLLVIAPVDLAFSFSVSTFIIFFFVDVVLLSKYRQLIKILYSLSVADNTFSKAVIYGAGVNSTLFIGLIEQVVSKGFKVVGIIDPERRLSGKRINDIKIYHLNELDYLINRQQIKKLFFSSENDLNKFVSARKKSTFGNVSVSLINASSLTMNIENVN